MVALALTVWSGLLFAQNATPTEVVIEVCQNGMQPQQYCQSISTGSNSASKWCGTGLQVEKVNEARYKCSVDSFHKGYPSCPNEVSHGRQTTGFCDFTVETEYQCLDPDYPLPEYDPQTGIVVACHATECNQEIATSGEPSPDDIAFYQQYGYVCSPEEWGNCKMTHVGSTGSGAGSTHYWVESNNEQCPESGPGSRNDPGNPVGDPFTSSGSGSEPGAPGTNPAGNAQCGQASPWSQFCNGDPSNDCYMSNGLQICNEGCGYMNEHFICTNPDYQGENPFGPPIDPPDGDITGDGKVNIDMGPTNLLLQQIRNNTAKIATNTVNTGSGSPGGGSPPDTGESGIVQKLEEINQEIKGANNPKAEDFDMEEYLNNLQQRDDKKDEIFAEDGSWFDIGDDDESFFESLKTQILGRFTTDVTNFFSGGSCPVYHLEDPQGGAYTIDLSENIQPTIQWVLQYVIWFMAIWTSYFMFFRWAMS